MKQTILLVLAFGVTAQAAPIVWRPPIPEDAARIERALIARPGADPETVVREMLVARQYYWAQLAYDRDTLIVESGPKGVPGDIHIALADTTDTVRLTDIFGQALAGRTSPVAIAAALQAIVEYYVSVGRPFAQARLAGIDTRNAPGVAFTVIVTPGPEVHSRELEIAGARSRQYLFTRQSAWRSGQPITADLIDRTHSALAALPSVATIDTATLIPSSTDSADLHFTIRETPAIRVGGVVGWIPRSGARAGYWTGEGDLRLLSPFGSGRNFHFFAGRRDRESRHTIVELWEPWPLGLPFWAGVSLSQRDFDTSFIETSATLSLALTSTPLRWQLSGHWSKITPEEAPSDLIFPSRRRGIGISVADSNASGSFRLAVEWTEHRLYNRGNQVPAEPRLTHSQGTFSARHRLTLSRSVALRVLGDAGGTLIRSEFVPPDLRFRVGGVHSLRGYDEEQFLTDNFLRWAGELHFGSHRQSVFIFGDSGWLSFPNQPDLVLTSFGAGLNIAQRLLLMVAVPGRGGLDQTKVHIALSSGL